MLLMRDSVEGASVAAATPSNARVMISISTLLEKGASTDDAEGRGADQEQAAAPDAVAERAHRDQEPGQEEAVDVGDPQQLRARGVEIGGQRGNGQIEDRQVQRVQEAEQRNDGESDPFSPTGFEALSAIMSPISSAHCDKGARTMAVHSETTPFEAADRLAIRELFDAYAHCADRRDAEGQKALFTADTRFAVYMDGEGSEPTYVLEGREALTPVFADLNRYEATTHFNGQSTVDGDRATGESYTIAHHLFTEDGERKIMIASLRYLDTFVKIDGSWYFAERQLLLDWSETRPSSSGT
jgi:hypothetical protein